jgi:hypothetical protein
MEAQRKGPQLLDNKHKCAAHWAHGQEQTAAGREPRAGAAWPNKQAKNKRQLVEIIMKFQK